MIMQLKFKFKTFFLCVCKSGKRATPGNVQGLESAQGSLLAALEETYDAEDLTGSVACKQP